MLSQRRSAAARYALCTEAGADGELSFDAITRLGTLGSVFRRFLLILCAMSLLLGTATIALWIRSYWFEYDVVRQDHPYSEQLAANSCEGRLLINRICLRQPGGGSSDWSLYKIDLATIRKNASDLPTQPIRMFDLLHSFASGSRERDIVFPHWALAAILLALSAGLYLQSRIARDHALRRHGLCIQCGYDLRASPDRCPECGKPRSTSESSAVRAALQGARGFELAICCLLVWAIWWIDPWRGAAAGQGLAPEIGIGFYPIWESNRGADDQRMHRIDASWGEEWDQALLRQPDGDHLLVIGESDGSSFGSFKRVFMLDRSMRVIRTGRVHPFGKPVRPIEIKADDDSLPASIRSKWLLGVEWQTTPMQWPAASSDLPALKDSDYYDGWILWDNGPQLPGELYTSEMRTIRSAEENPIEN